MTIHKTTLRHGDTLHVLLAASPEELATLVASKTAGLLRPNGAAVVDAAGRSVHVVDEEVHPYQWDAAGDRVRGVRVRVEVPPAGEPVRTVLKKIWVRPS
jgi:hypothetical protein